jgi:hypothetical protein
MSKKEETLKDKSCDEIIDMMTKKKQISASVINLFKEIDKIKKTEIEPLIKKTKADPSEKNLLQLRHYFVAFEQLETNILQISSERIVKTLAEVEHIDTKEESEPEDSESEESESEEESEEEEKPKKVTKPKVVEKKKVVKKSKKSESESDEDSE